MSSLSPSPSQTLRQAPPTLSSQSQGPPSRFPNRTPSSLHWSDPFLHPMGVCPPLRLSPRPRPLLSRTLLPSLVRPRPLLALMVRHHPFCEPGPSFLPSQDPGPAPFAPCLRVWPRPQSSGPGSRSSFSELGPASLLWESSPAPFFASGSGPAPSSLSSGTPLSYLGLDPVTILCLLPSL